MVWYGCAADVLQVSPCPSLGHGFDTCFPNRQWANPASSLQHRSCLDIFFISEQLLALVSSPGCSCECTDTQGSTRRGSGWRKSLAAGTGVAVFAAVAAYCPTKASTSGWWCYSRLQLSLKHSSQERCLWGLLPLPHHKHLPTSVLLLFVLHLSATSLIPQCYREFKHYNTELTAWQAVWISL